MENIFKAIYKHFKFRRENIQITYLSIILTKTYKIQSKTNKIIINKMKTFDKMKLGFMGN